MDQGRLADQGTIEELISRPGPFRKLWDKQAGFVMDTARHQAAISLDRLRQVPVVYGMPDELLAEAVHLFHSEEYPAGHVVLRQGEFGACLYIIVRGSFQSQTLSWKRATASASPRCWTTWPKTPR